MAVGGAAAPRKTRSYGERRSRKLEARASVDRWTRRAGGESTQQGGRMSCGGRETLWECVVSAGTAVSAEFIKTFNSAMECVIWGKPLVSIPGAAERERVCEPGRAEQA